MFGVFYAIAQGLLGGAALINESVENKKARERTINYELGTYCDRHCHQKAIVNDHPVMISQNKEGDSILLDLKTDQILKNYSEERRQKSIDKEMRAGRDIVFWKKYTYADTIPDKAPTGERYKNVKTGEIYVIRSLGGLGDYYFNLKGYAVCPTYKELEKLNGQYSPEEVKKRIEEVISETNRKQDMTSDVIWFGRRGLEDKIL